MTKYIVKIERDGRPAQTVNYSDGKPMVFTDRKLALIRASLYPSEARARIVRLVPKPVQVVRPVGPWQPLTTENLRGYPDDATIIRKCKNNGFSISSVQGTRFGLLTSTQSRMFLVLPPVPSENA